MIQEGKIAEVRERASIVEVISDHLTLRKTGRNYSGLCPFHSEKTPSFTVSEEKGIFHCFGCGAGGSVFHFLMQYERLTFPEAVERIARRYGIPLEHADRGGRPDQAGEKESLYRLNERAAAYFQQVLFHEREGKRAREYLKDRGVDEASSRRFLLGYAPQGPGLVNFIKKEGLSAKGALRLGLIGERGPQRFHEKFFARLMFPIANPSGRVIGFGGRVLSDGFPKYLNSSESSLFRKGSTLYGLCQAKDAIRKADRVVVVEGYLDVIALAQFDVSYAVATLGTALTPSHVRILGRYTKNIIALFDGDDAGQKAAARSFEIFLEGGLLGRTAFLPKGEDPDTFVRGQGKAALEGILDRAVPLADYYFSWLEQLYGTSLEGKSQIAGEISRLLGKIENPFEVDLLVGRAVDRLGVREELLRRSPVHNRGRTNVQNQASPAAPPKSESRDDAAERSLVSLMLRFPSVIRRMEEEKDLESLIDPKWRDLVERIFAVWRSEGELDVARLAQAVPSDQASRITALAMEAESVPEMECDKMAADCLAHLQRKYLRGLERNLRMAIRTAEEEKDEKAKRERILEWQDVVRRERQLERRRFASKSEAQ